MAFKKIPLTIDTMIRNPVPVEGINQEDNIELNIVVTENKTPKDLSSQTIKVYVRRIDGTLVEQTDQITPTNASKGEVTVKLKNSAFNKEGYALFQLDISDSSGRITSSYATFKIGKGLVSGEVIANTNEIEALKQIEEYVKKANKELETFKQTVVEINENEATRQENERIRVRGEAEREDAEQERKKTLLGIDEKISNYENKILDLKEESGKYLNENGAIISGLESFKIATLNVEEGERYKIIGTYVGLQRLVCLYGEGEKKIKIIPEQEGELQKTTQTVVVTIPKEVVKMVVCSFEKSNEVFELPVLRLDSVRDASEEIKKIQKRTENILEMQKIIQLEQANKYVGSNGKVLSLETPNFRFKELKVEEKERFKVRGKCTGWQRLYSLMNEKEEVVEVFPDVGGSLETQVFEKIVEIPKGVKKINVSSSYDFNENITILPVLQMPTEETKKEFITNYEYVFENIICIGDSLISGATYTEAWGENASPGASIDQNIPRFLERMLNCKTTNAGKSGWSASDWYRDYIIPETYNFSEYDSALIWLGTNYGCDAMPSDEEIESFIPTSVPLGQANTVNQAQYLIKIIKEIKKANSDCYIMLCTCFASKSNLTNNNNVLAQIAEKYSCHLIDMSDLGLKEHPELHGGVQNVHFGKAGNIFVASRIINSVKEKMLSNPLLCEFGYTPRKN